METTQSVGVLLERAVWFNRTLVAWPRLVGSHSGTI